MTPSPHRILLVEDDPRIAQSVRHRLQEEGFAVELRVQAHGTAEHALGGAFDLILLDLGLPEGDGLEILRVLGSRSAVPVLVLTARADLQSRLDAFAAGAVDFVPKPFWMDELLARIRRRLGGGPALPSRVVRVGDVEVDLERRVAARGGVDLELSPSELNVLLYLLDRPGRPVTREQIVEHALPLETEAGPRTVDAHVSRIRKKLGSEAASHLRTVFRLGYRFDP